jgi:hypothetical protein
MPLNINNLTPAILKAKEVATEDYVDTAVSNIDIPDVPAPEATVIDESAPTNSDVKNPGTIWRHIRTNDPVTTYDHYISLGGGSWQFIGGTYVNGSNIVTGSIDAARINTNGLIAETVQANASITSPRITSANGRFEIDSEYVGSHPTLGSYTGLIETGRFNGDHVTARLLEADQLLIAASIRPVVGVPDKFWEYDPLKGDFESHYYASYKNLSVSTAAWNHSGRGNAKLRVARSHRYRDPYYPDVNAKVGRFGSRYARVSFYWDAYMGYEKSNFREWDFIRTKIIVVRVNPNGSESEEVVKDILLGGEYDHGKWYFKDTYGSSYTKDGVYHRIVYTGTAYNSTFDHYYDLYDLQVSGVIDIDLQTTQLDESSEDSFYIKIVASNGRDNDGDSSSYPTFDYLNVTWVD